ncbi:MAG: CoA-disulfide reductase [Methylococcaceae bacterium]|nr:CoA-disulfide reductase [Methylococcaceae bacterium]
MVKRTSKRILVVGGVAGGASCATRARRLCEACEIVLFDRGPHVSFANCGLPYRVGDVIESDAKLLVATPELFRERFNIDVCTETEVLRIDRPGRRIEVKDLRTGELRWEPYDALVLATGANPITPRLPGVDLPGIQVLRTIPDTRRLRDAVARTRHAVLVGAGLIGLELAENLVRRGLQVTLIEAADQVLPPLDPEMACYVRDTLLKHGVDLRLGETVDRFAATGDGGLSVQCASGAEVETGLVILGIGVRPETTLARGCGLELGALGGIRVDEHMRTGDPHIWAVGDVVEVRNRISGDWQLLPLAGPANRQGRVAGTDIINRLAGRDRHAPPPSLTFNGSLGTAVCEVFGLTAAVTGLSEKALRRQGTVDFERVYLHPGHHASYFPGAKPIHIKLLFEKPDGRILGAQAVGEADVARRIDVIATAMAMGATVYDLEELELCYAPQFGAAKDPVNVAGMIAANHLRGDLPLAAWSDLATTDALLLDVRSEAEYHLDHLEGALNIPLEQLRARLGELPGNRDIRLICGVGQRAYYATRILAQHGFRVQVLSGGLQTYRSRCDGYTAPSAGSGGRRINPP